METPLNTGSQQTATPPSAQFEPMAQSTPAMCTPENKKCSPIAYIVAGIIVIGMLAALGWWGSRISQMNNAVSGGNLPIDTPATQQQEAPAPNQGAEAMTSDLDVDIQQDTRELDAMDAEIDAALSQMDAQLK